jgi:membrane associated rhomboid family serine protease
MGKPTRTNRLFGALAGLIIGVGLGALMGMGADSIIFAAAIGGCIGLLLGFCRPRAATYIFGEFLNPF